MEPARLGAGASRGRYLVDDVVVDLGQRKLLRGGEALPVTRLTFDLLLALVDEAPNLVSHATIIERVWGPRRVVTPETLAQCALRLRHALGDSAAKPRYFESVRGQGYRLIPEVREVPDQPAATSASSGAQTTPAWRPSLVGVAAIIVLVVLGAVEFGRVTRGPEALASNLSDSERARLEAQPTTSAEAYEFFLTASKMFEVDSTDRSKIARSYLDKAIELDPKFALAYGLKALIHAYGIDDFTDSAEDLVAVNLERARQAEDLAAAALEIDPGTIAAHRARAIIGVRSWRWTAAERAFESALRYGPSDVVTLSEFAFFRVCALGDHSGLQYARRALELDPRSPRAHELYGRALGCTGEHQSALNELRRSVELDPTNFRRRAMSAYAAAHVLPSDEIAAELKALEPMMTDTRLSGFPAIALTYAGIGDVAEARRIVAHFEALNGHGTTNIGSSIFAYLAVGDDEAAYRTLERAVEHLGPGSGYLTLLAIRDNQRKIAVLDTPRFVRLRNRIGSRD